MAKTELEAEAEDPEAEAAPETAPDLPEEEAAKKKKKKKKKKGDKEEKEEKL